MKIFLISANRTTEPYPVFPLGLATIAEALRRAGHTVETFDCLWDTELEQRIRAFAPGLVGISLRNIDNENSLGEEWYLDEVRELVGRIRSVFNFTTNLTNTDAQDTLKNVREVRGKKNIPVIALGGAGFSIMPDAILDYTGADYGMAGEGERIIVELADTLAAGGTPPVRILRQSPPLAPADIGAGLRDATWIAQYASNGGGFGIQTKRGCPHACVYCSYPSIEGRTIRARDPEAVADELAWMHKHCSGVPVFFTDSLFNDTQGLWRNLVDTLLTRGNRIPWSAYFRPADITAEDITLMKRAGLRSAELGTDAASDTALRGLRKSFTFGEAAECNRLFIEQAVPAAHFLMFGGPDETPESVREGVANIRRLNGAVIFPFMGIRILPGTPLHERAMREGFFTTNLTNQHEQDNTKNVREVGGKKTDNENSNLLHPVYYLSPSLDRATLHAELSEAFAEMPNVVFPPDKMRDFTVALRNMGHAGSLWELFAAAQTRRNRRRPT